MTQSIEQKHEKCSTFVFKNQERTAGQCEFVKARGYMHGMWLRGGKTESFEQTGPEMRMNRGIRWRRVDYRNILVSDGFTDEIVWLGERTFLPAALSFIITVEGLEAVQILNIKCYDIGNYTDERKDRVSTLSADLLQKDKFVKVLDYHTKRLK